MENLMTTDTKETDELIKERRLIAYRLVTVLADLLRNTLALEYPVSTMGRTVREALSLAYDHLGEVIEEEEAQESSDESLMEIIKAETFADVEAEELFDNYNRLRVERLMGAAQDLGVTKRRNRVRKQEKRRFKFRNNKEKE